MPSNANVIVEYGPYRSNGIIDYRDDRLLGLQKFLKLKGHNLIEIKKVESYNCVNIIVNEQVVFKCKIDEFEFGGDGEIDPLVIKAGEEIQNAY